jgi:ribulose-phosphate 3-epimerase
MKIAPSLVSANFAKIARADRARRRGRRGLPSSRHHGRTVRPPDHRGAKIIADLRPLSALRFDAYLMIVEPEKHVGDMCNAGANVISFHLETTPHAQRLLGYVKSLGAKAGIALDPQTPVAMLSDLIADIDLILIMSVNAGYSGQAYIPNSVNKVHEARQLIDAHNPA